MTTIAFGLGLPSPGQLEFAGAGIVIVYCETGLTAVVHTELLEIHWHFLAKKKYKQIFASVQTQLSVSIILD